MRLADPVGEFGFDVVVGSVERHRSRRQNQVCLRCLCGLARKKGLENGRSGGGIAMATREPARGAPLRGDIDKAQIRLSVYDFLQDLFNR